MQNSKKEHKKLKINQNVHAVPDILNVKNFAQPDFRWNFFLPKRYWFFFKFISLKAAVISKYYTKIQNFNKIP